MAVILGMTAETVSRYIASGNRGGPDALIPGKSSGQPSKIPPELTADIRAALPQTPLAVGYGESTKATRINYLNQDEDLKGINTWIHISS